MHRLTVPTPPQIVEVPKVITQTVEEVVEVEKKFKKFIEVCRMSYECYGNNALV